MKYYLFKEDDRVVGFLETESSNAPYGAEEVSKEEFEKYSVASEPTNPVDYLKDVEIPLATKLEAITERQEFLEDCIAEMAAKVYSDV